MLSESCKMDLEDDSTNLSPPVACTPTSANTTNTVMRKSVKLCHSLCDDNPSKIQPANPFQSTSSTQPSSISSFKTVLQKFDSLQTSKTSKLPQKQQKVNPADGIVTSDEQFDRLLAHALKKDEIEMEKKEKKKKRKEENRQKKIRKKRRNTKGIKTSVIKQNITKYLIY